MKRFTRSFVSKRRMAGFMAALALLLGGLKGMGHADSEGLKDLDSPPNTVAAFVSQQLAKGKKPNRLILEKSPYLLLHAFNPVDWYPWGKEAFEKARREDKPLFVSIGYSTCHWCHVMEKESFANPEVAAILDRYFVSIKVDREERPDLDEIYMAATRALTGSGGWPMNVFLTHDLKPFYAGTYFPSKGMPGRPGFTEVLEAVHRAWVEKRQSILGSAEKITAYLREQSKACGPQAELGPSFMRAAFEGYRRMYDEENGGFGSRPKFPRPESIDFLFRFYQRSGEKRSLDMAVTTLRKMAMGGIHDHLGGGFHRYSVDGQWRIPHFEKMLYDQAQLAVSYLTAYQITKESFFAEVARDILEYTLRDMRNPEGGFYSAEDADSPLPGDLKRHGEGAFYLWSKSEVDRILGRKSSRIFCYYFGIQDGGNIPEGNGEEDKGRNILYVEHSMEEVASKFQKPLAVIEAILKEGIRKLLSKRRKRPRPQLDDKAITSWNGLMIRALAKGYQVLGEARYLEAAEQAAAFVKARLYDRKDQSLFRRYRSGEAGLEAHLNDYAFLVQGLLDLYEGSLDMKWLEWAKELTARQMALFWDEEHGGLYDTSGKDPTLLFRAKEAYDGAIPSGNSVSCLNLLRLARMLHMEEWEKKAGRVLKAFSGRIEDQPEAMPAMLSALDFQMSVPKQVIIAGKWNDEATRKMFREVYEPYLPNKIVLFLDGGKAQELLSHYLPFVSGMKMMDGRPTAYVCENYACRMPTNEIAVLARLLTE